MDTPAPSASPLKAPWSLSFLSGPLYGRTIALKLGDNWVGSGADCDAIVADGEISPRQLRLSVGQIAVTVQNVGEAEASLNGAPLDSARRALRHGDVIEMGSIRLGIVPAQQPRELPPEAPAAKRGGALAQLAQHPWPAWAASRRVLVTLAALWGVMVLAGGAYLAIGATNPFWFQASATERLDQVVEALHDYPEVKVVPTGEGFVVFGYVNSLSDRDRVQRLVQSFPQTTVGDVYVIDELLGSARLYFSDTPLTVAYAGHGKVVVGGAGARSLQQRVANFSKDAKPALQVIDRVAYEDTGAAPRKPKPSAGEVPDIVGVYDDGTGTRFIETADGARYFEGSHLPGGLELQHVGADGVVFSRGSDRFFMQVSGAAMHALAPPPG